MPQLPAGGPAFPLAATDLARWDKFALKGGIGRAIAKADRSADLAEDLMFFRADEVVVLLDLDNGVFLGYCEGVVGKFNGADVTFTTKLKRPVLIPRNSSPAAAPPVSSTATSSALPLNLLRSENLREGAARRSKSVDLPRIEHALAPCAKLTVSERTPNLEGPESIAAWRTSDAEPQALQALPWVQAGVLPSAGKPRAPWPTTVIPRTSASLPFDAQPQSPSSTASSPSLVPRSPRSAFSGNRTPSEAHTPPLPFSDSPLPSPQLVSTARFTPPPPSPPLSVRHSLPPTPRPETPAKDAYQPPALHSKFSDASPASSRLRSKFSDGPSLLDFASSQASPAMSTRHLPTLSELDSSSQPHSEREPKSSSESTASGWEDDSVFISTTTPGEQTEIFGAIFDSYRYSRGSEAGSAAPSPSPSSPADSPASRRNSSPADMRRYAPSPSRSRLTPDSIREEAFAEDDDENLPVTPLRYGAASALRTQLVAQRSAGSTPGLTPVPAAKSQLPASESNESVLTASIPRLRDLFPRSSTTDSFGSLSSLLSANTPNGSPNKASPESPASSTSPSPPQDDKPAAPLPAPVPDGEDGAVPVPRRLFQTYFSPPKALDQPPRSKTVLGIPDSPSTTSPRSLRKRRPSAKGLVIGAPVAIPGSAWRSTDESPTRFDDDIFSYATSSSATPPPAEGETAHPETPTTTLTFLSSLSDSFPAPPSSTVRPPSVTVYPASPFPQKSDYVDENPPEMNTRMWMPKLTIPSDSPSPTTFEYALRPTAPPVALPTRTVSTLSTDRTFPKSPTFAAMPSSPQTTSIPRSKSVGSLRESTGPARLRKQPSLKLKHSQAAHLRAETGSSVSYNSSHDLAAFSREDVSSPPPPNVMPKSSSTGSIFHFARKRAATVAAAVPDPYGAPVSSKDFESERVQVNNAEFDMVKPLAALLLKDDDFEPPHHHAKRPSVSSSIRSPGIYGRPSMASPRPGDDVFDEGDEQGSDADDSPAAHGDAKAVEIYRAKELAWVKAMAGVSAHATKRSKKSRALVQSGVPSSVRGKVWSYLAETNVDKVQGLYQSLCAADTHLWQDAIANDVAIAFRNDPQFAPGSTGRDDLEAVLNALSRYDNELGYAKGLALTAGLILSHVPAEETFWILVSLINRYGFRSYFGCAFESLLLEVRIFGIILDSVDSKLSEHLREHSAGPEAFLPSWFSTLFASALPSESRLRCADLFFYAPSSALRVALAILDLARARLLACQSRAAILEIFRGLPFDGTLEPQALMPTVFTIKLRDDKVKSARKKAEASIGKVAKG